jgi:hypothetical protein
MKSTLLAVLLAMSFLTPTSTAVAEAPTIPPAPPRPLTVQELVVKYASQYDVSASEMMTTIKCEDKDLNPKLQSYERYKRDHPEWGVKAGEREKSFGLVQIHLPAHPNVTLAQATDPEFAIEFMASEFSKGHQRQWTCYRNLIAMK